MNIDEVLDRKELFIRIDDDMELLQELVELFLEDYPQLLENIKTAVENQDAVGLKQAAHALKGSVGNFCADKAFQHAADLEERGDAGNLANAEQVVDALENEMKKVDSALQALAMQGAS